jgi:hypothetical protein
MNISLQICYILTLVIFTSCSSKITTNGRPSGANNSDLEVLDGSSGAIAAAEESTTDTTSFSWSPPPERFYSAVESKEITYEIYSSSGEIIDVASLAAATKIGTTTELTYTVTALAPATTHYFNILAVGAGLNAPILYQTVKITTQPDTTPPVVGVFADSTSVTSSGCTINWTTSTDAWQAAGVYRVFIKLPNFERFFRAG